MNNPWLEDHRITGGQSTTSAVEYENLSQVIKIDGAKVGSHLHDLVRKTVKKRLTKCSVPKAR